MRITSAQFAAAAVKPAQYPSDGLPQFALVGRSNVGKSSLINALLNKKGLARTSSTPGRTRTINFYKVNGGFYIVDLPGYGFADAPGRLIASWRAMTDAYFQYCPALAGVVAVLDPRRDPDESAELYEWIESLQVPALTVLTKCDKLSSNEKASRLAAYKRGLDVREPVAFSSLTGAGRAELLKRLSGLLAMLDADKG